MPLLLERYNDDIYQYYDQLVKTFQWNQQNEWVVKIMGNEENKVKRQKITINDGDGDTMTLLWEKKKITITGWLEAATRTKNSIMIGIS